MTESLLIDLAMFDGDDLLCRTSIKCDGVESKDIFGSDIGHQFETLHRVEEHACPLSIQCNFDGEILYGAALGVGVHNSEDWESINLGDIHTLGIRCHVVT